MLSQLKKIIPKKIFHFFQPTYHWLLSFVSAILYRFPSRSLRVIAITGTKGKTSTAEIMNAILEEAGHTTALASSLRFKIGNESRTNTFGMSMPGRGYIQKFLRGAVKKGCDFAVIEMTSEGARQFRHAWIYPDAFIFTNLAPEHIESHGSFELYVKHKQRIPALLNSTVKERRIAIINADDAHKDDFTPKKATEVIYYSLTDGEPYSSGDEGISFTLDGVRITSPLTGEFMIRNMIAASRCAQALGIEMPVISRALSKLSLIRGRMEFVKLPQSHPQRNLQTFDVVVDYAHTIESLEALYSSFPNKRKICVLGNTGGGRDTWKRPGMAGVADNLCDEIILTTEDPYDEDPLSIIEDMKKGITKKTPIVIVDRREAIEKAIEIAQPGNVILLSGMGSQQYMCVKNGEKIPWDDVSVAREAIEKKFASS